MPSPMRTIGQRVLPAFEDFIDPWPSGNELGEQDQGRNEDEEDDTGKRQSRQGQH